MIVYVLLETIRLTVIEYRFSKVLLRRKCLEIPNGNALIL